MLTLAQSRKGINTAEGLKMAKNKFQLDEKAADRDGDGKLSKYEETVGKAIQEAINADKLVKMAHGGMPCGIMSEETPLGATENEMADDIPALISENEYVLNAQTVKWHGLKHIMQMQEEAEAGLMSMYGMGLLVEVDGETQEEPDGEGVEDAQVSDAGYSEQEAEDYIETPEGNEIELASVETIYEEPDVDETEEYQNNSYGKMTSYSMMKTPKVSFIV